MKKIISLFLVVAFCITGIHVSASKINTSNWHEYNSHTSSHSFSVKFPSNWKTTSLGKNKQGIQPGINLDPVFTIREFEGYTYKEVIGHYHSSSFKFWKEEDFLFRTETQDLIGKKLYFMDETSQKSEEKIAIRRGRTIVVMAWEKNNQESISEEIKKSFVFTDNWQTYIDFEEKYTFIAPSNFRLEESDLGILVKNTADKVVFSVSKHKNASLDEAEKESRGKDEKLISSNQITFHSIGDATEMILTTKDNEQKRKVIFEKEADAYVLEDLMFSVGAPEILESFDFFDVEEGQILDKDYVYFSDITNDHINSRAINALTKKNVFSGYEDGTFGPEKNVNRAELTKMIVPPSIYLHKNIFRNCFLDVKEEWFARYVCYAKARGVIEGYEDGNFQPSKIVNRAEALKLIVGTAATEKVSKEELLKDNFVEDVSSTDWYAPYFIYADNRNLLDKNHATWVGEKYKYHPGEPITRQELAELIYRIMR
jgi:hypothetical protein